MKDQTLQQFPPPGSRCLRHAGDVLTVRLHLTVAQAGTAVLRTNLGHAAMGRRERIDQVEQDRPPAASDWQDLPMRPVSDTDFLADVPLTEEGRFEAKACFLPQGATSPVWPDGDNLVIKVEPAFSICANSIYTAFVRLHTADASRRRPRRDQDALRRLDARGYAVIPPSGTFRDLIPRLDWIMGHMGFRWIQLLPIHPTPTTHARMGRFGSPFAGLDFRAVDPALAVFDGRATPLDQFRELVDAVHARGGRLLMDLPANHTGWASSLMLHHPEWFRRNADGTFQSPGAWGVTWEDLVALDYRHDGLRRYMAEVFRFWCLQGVDGFRCDAGYMVPYAVWAYIVARIRQDFPETLFLLEGLGGKVEVTRQLLADANLNWAYSELFQTEDRAAFERDLPGALDLSKSVGPLAHFAETHDNPRLAARGETYAVMRTALAALLSHHGTFGISNGVEWFAAEKIDVHEMTALRWGARRNQTNRVRRLNHLLAVHSAFGPGVCPRLITADSGPVLAAVRGDGDGRLLVLANLDCDAPQRVAWPQSEFSFSVGVMDGLNDRPVTPRFENDRGVCDLAPGEVRCLGLAVGFQDRGKRRAGGIPPSAVRQARRLTALRIRRALTGQLTLAAHEDADTLAAALFRDSRAYCRRWVPHGEPVPLCVWSWPTDSRRHVMLLSGWVLQVCSPHPFRCALLDMDGNRLAHADSLAAGKSHRAWLCPAWDSRRAHVPLQLEMAVHAPDGTQRSVSPLLGLSRQTEPGLRLRFSGAEVRRDAPWALLANGRGAMAQVRARWGEIRSQYDGFLCANVHDTVPVDRTVIWTRCRAWVRFQGYSQSVDADSLSGFEVDPGGTRATWHFQLTAGNGRRMALVFSLRMTRGRNRVVLNITRAMMTGNDTTEFDAIPVQVVLRPDIEWRNFHEKTKAFHGHESRWPHAVTVDPAGFRFQPFDQNFRMRLDVGRFHAEPQWQYMVAHPDDAERGLDDASDLFSPGYFTVDLCAGQRAHLEAAVEMGGETGVEEAAIVHDPKQRFSLWQGLSAALDAFVVRRDALHSVIAGYPWFLDWGRDTLIVLRGLIADGRTAVAQDILREFGRFERGGTLPNMIRGDDDRNRDTSDAPLWFLRAAWDLCLRLGFPTVLEADCGGRTLAAVAESIVRGYCEGTSNGIRVDPQSGLVFSPAHFSWMDTNHPAGTPRQGYPVEIQALWIDALRFVGSFSAAERWRTLAQTAVASFDHYYCDPRKDGLCDCLHADPGTPADQAVADDALRCNAVLALALGSVRDPARARRALAVYESLLVPGGIRSLADRPLDVPLEIRHEGQLLGNPCSPYRGRYAGSEDWDRKPAYHNGTAWTWVFPSYVEALWDLHDHSPNCRETALALLGSVAVVFNRGCVAQVPEILDGDAPHVQRGCGAQAWGVSEALRVWHKIRDDG